MERGEWPFCPHGKPMFHVHSGKVVWTGEQAYGKKKAHSDEMIADLHAEMVSGKGG